MLLNMGCTTGGINMISRTESIIYVISILLFIVLTTLQVSLVSESKEELRARESPKAERKVPKKNNPPSSFFPKKEVEQVVTKKQTQPAQIERKEWTDTYTITAYTNGYESTGKRKGDAGYGITYSGEPTKDNYTLACPPNIPIGTKIKIEGVGVRVCEDRGGAIKGKRLDIFIRDLQSAREWGKQDRRIRIIK